MLTDGLAAHFIDVDKTYSTASGNVTALGDITAEFASSALTAVAGPSGSGKSSLLRLLAGMDRSTSGSIQVGGVRLETARPRTLRRVRREVVGYVFQRPSDNFIPRLSVDEHLRVIAASSTSSPLIDPGDLLQLLGIADRRNHLPAELSGGEQQRAAFAQVLMAGVSIVVADEPTAELDSTSAEVVLDTIAALTKRGVTFVLATHDTNVTERADALVRLDHGRVITAPTHWRPAGPRDRSESLPRPGRSRSSGAAAEELNHEMPVLELQSLSKSYRRGHETVHALRDVDLSVVESEFVGLVGRSGSGKTTLLNVASGWERQDSGHVSIAGRDTAASLPGWHEVALVPQRLGLMEELTIRENIEYPSRLDGSVERLQWFVDDLIDAMGLRELQHRYPAETSVGEQQRTALARALVLSPRLVLADEPTGHQDREWAKGVVDALRRSVAGGSACVTATHDQELIQSLDRVVWLSDGQAVDRTA